jgi:transcriptional regulator with XRE-family HTH domain
MPITRRVRMIERSRSTLLPGLSAHRRQRGLTQRQLGELAGVAHTTVQQLESLRRGAYPQTMRKLVTALGIAPEELLHKREPNAKGHAGSAACPSQTTYPRTPYQQHPERPSMNNLQELNPVPTSVQES